MKRASVACLFAAAAAACSVAQAQICDPPNACVFVDADATGANSGTDWTNAYTDLQSALTYAAGSGADEIIVWVAEGTYLPTELSDALDPRSAVFDLPADVQLYGGFAGGETALSQANPSSHPTVLSGNIGAASDSDNSYHVVKSSARATLSGFTITAGLADGAGSDSDGAGIYNSGAGLDVEDCLITGNEAARNGGGMYNSGGTPALTDTEFLSNAADGKGGAIYNNAASPTLDGCSLRFNQADEGGAIYSASSSTPDINDTLFSNNSAVHDGGAMYNKSASNATVTECSFSNNDALNGGAVRNDGSSPTFTDSTFTGNDASGNGGAFYNTNSNPAITDCKLNDNDAGDNGGAIFNASSHPTITDTTFDGNTADVNGGAIANDVGSPSISHCEFIDNIAGSRGGAMYNHVASDPKVDACRFIENRAGLGGAVSSQGEVTGNPDPTFTNGLFVGNSATASGGAIHSFDSTTTLTNSTIFANRAGALGGGVYANASSEANPLLPTIANTIIWANTDQGGTPQSDQIMFIVADQVENPTTVTYSCIQSLGGGSNGNISADPAFIDGDGADDTAGNSDDDLRLSAFSPCVDSGDDSAISGQPKEHDLDDLTRIVDDPLVEDGDAGNIDMGAYEYQYDCNNNGVLDSADIADELSDDCDANGVPDECELANDTDDDGVIDACDGCPDDPDKSAPGVCGCGTADVDANSNGVVDCLETDNGNTNGPPADDTDNDGVANSQDNCPLVANSGQLDSDNDGVGDACDGCPNDPDKTTAGICGCGEPETDTDADGVPDCIDNCPTVLNANQDDQDEDGVGDFCDGCPEDPNKISAGICGCGIPDTDADSDGVPNCLDNCPETEAGVQVDDAGCPIITPDADGDGVPDNLDFCPNTTAGTDVDSNGCPTGDGGDQSDSSGCGSGAGCGALGVVSIWTLLLGFGRFKYGGRRRRLPRR